MSIFQGNAILVKPEVLLRFVLFEQGNRDQRSVLGPDTWIDFETAFGTTFQFRTEHELTFPDQARANGRYVVAAVPFMQPVAHPNGSGVRVPLMTLYLVEASQWPKFSLLLHRTDAFPDEHL
ncbi:hypothetical protein [Spirosoma sp. KUDC1026]|uniref:hypothetical protein n=1 Tax=Spirosoma sp. KUDC1026 TaxID=2745947 RepID=UPI00159B8737|nr:hypothetical protein [Spirosoma sp. KUDC1026]QKZ12927.1 hypothetical protein HU175_09905 [Spirosoma sp. KUDC1026]